MSDPDAAPSPVPGGPAPDDLSLNETPYPPLLSVRRAVEQESLRLNRYPDYDSAELVAALATRLAVPGDRVLVGPGSAGLCQILLQSLGPQRQEVVHAALSYEAYPLLVANVGARPVPVPLVGYDHDLAAMADAVGPNTRCVLVCNPNNPTAAVLRRGDLESFLDHLPQDVVVIVDEAYREFVSDPEAANALDLYRTHDNVCVLRTFSKAYGLATLRVGYAVVPPAVAAKARMVGRVFFPGGLGQVAALASLRPEAEAELARRRCELLDARSALRQALLAEGLAVAPSETNFVWVPLGDAASDFAEGCRRAGVLVRPYPGQGVRITVGSPAANARLCAAVGEIRRRALAGAT